MASIRHFRVYLLCHKFCIVTYSLVYIRSSPNPNSRLLRWRLDLEEYDFYVKHKPGLLNANADYLSRIIVGNEQPINISNIRQARIQDNNSLDTPRLDAIEEEEDINVDEMVILL